MENQNGIRFDVYELDMWSDGDGGWTENARYKIGSIHVPDMDVGDMTEVEILKVMKKAAFRSMTGTSFHPLTTRNRKRVYAEDYYGDGKWWEVGIVKGHQPLYGLALVARRKDGESNVLWTGEK